MFNFLKISSQPNHINLSNFSPLEIIIILEYFKREMDITFMFKDKLYTIEPNPDYRKKLGFDSSIDYILYMYIYLTILGDTSIQDKNIIELRVISNFIWESNRSVFKLLYNFRIYNDFSEHINLFCKNIKLPIYKFDYSEEDIRNALKFKLEEFKGDPYFYILINIHFIIYSIRYFKNENIKKYLRLVRKLIKKSKI